LAFWSAKVLKSRDPLDAGPVPFLRKWVEVITSLRKVCVLLVLRSTVSFSLVWFVNVDRLKGKPLMFSGILLFKSFVNRKNAAKHIYKDLRKI
jgi:hypothetical protein